MHEINIRLARLCSTSVAFVFLLTSAISVSAQESLYTDDFEQGTPIAWTEVFKLHPPTTFLITDLDLRDPHFFVPVPFLGCLDLTDDGIPGVTESLNQQLETATTGDVGNDGWLDFSFLLLFRPLDTLGEGLLDMRLGLCSAPLAGTSCDSLPMLGRLWAHVDSHDTGICLDTIPGSTSGYSPEIAVPAAPGFSTMALSTLLQIDGTTVPLYNAQIAATYSGDPTNELISGLVRAFVLESDADAIPIPTDIPLIGGQPVSTFLPGGTASCAALDDRDILVSQTGWWIYFNFEAVRVPYSEH